MKNKIRIGLICFIVTVCLISCDSKKSISKGMSDSIVADINDSLSIKIFLNEESNDFNTIIIKNKKNDVDLIFGFHSDGITPNIIGRERDGKRFGLYYTFYPSGRLNNKINYLDGEFDGDYESYSINGQIQYKAIFKNGVEKNVIVADSTSIIEIKK